MSRRPAVEDGQDVAAGRQGARDGRSTPPAALRRAADRFRRLPGIEVVWLAVRESRGASAVIRCGAGLRGTGGSRVTIQAGDGLGGHILQGATKPALVSLEDGDGISDDERAFLAGEHVTSAMVIPLANPGVNPGELRVDGLVYAARRDGGPLGTEIVARATELAGQVAFEVRYTQRLQEATERWDRLVHTPAEPDDAGSRLERLAKEIAVDARGILRAGIAMVYRLDRGLGVLHSLAIAGLQGVPGHLMPVLQRGQVLSPGWGSTGKAVARRRPCVIREYGPESVRVPPSMTGALPRMNTFTTLAVPLLLGDDVIGAITLARYVSMGGFVKREIRAAMRLALEAAPRVARALAAVEHAHRRHGGAILTRLAGSLTQSQGETAVCEQLAASVLGLVRGREVMVWDAEGHPLIPGLPLARILAHPHERRLERLQEEAWRTRQPGVDPSFAKTPSGGQVVDRSALIMPRSVGAAVGLHVSMASIQETIPRPPVRCLSLYAHLPAGGRWERGGTPPAWLNVTPAHLPVWRCPPSARPGRGISIPGDDQPRRPLTLPPTPLHRTIRNPVQRVVTVAETGLCVQLGTERLRPSGSRSGTSPARGRARERAGSAQYPSSMITLRADRSSTCPADGVLAKDRVPGPGQGLRISLETPRSPLILPSAPQADLRPGGSRSKTSPAGVGGRGGRGSRRPTTP